MTENGDKSWTDPEKEKKQPLNGGYENVESMKEKIWNRCRPSRARKAIQRRIPILEWLPKYTTEMFLCDLLAGLTVGLTAIPQGIAYAVVAGLEPQFGLYSGFMGCIAYFFLGSVKDITIGPTAIMALMTQKYVESGNSDFAILLCFLSGCIILLFGILHLGFLVSFISSPVTVGFTTAAAITIASSQLKSLLGIPGKTDDFLHSWISVVENIGKTRYEDLTLSFLTILALLSLKKLNDVIGGKYKNRGDLSKGEKFLKEFVCLIGLGRNAIVVVLGTGAAYAFFVNGLKPFILTGDIKGGMPQFRPPPFSTTFRNRTLSFDEMVAELGSSVISLPLISLLETIAIAKSFAKGRTLDATQEMIALGVANILGSFVMSMPTAGSFTRTAVNHSSGVRTPLGGLFTAALVISAVSLTSTFYFIPKATLAGVIFTAMFYMVEYHEFIATWRTKRADMIPMIATVISCLMLGLDFGILVGIAVNLTYILYTAARPAIASELLSVNDQSVLLARPEQSVSYPSAEYVRETIMKNYRKTGGESVLVVDGRCMQSLDSTAAKNWRTLAQDVEKMDRTLIFWNWQTSPMQSCIQLDNNLKKYFKKGDKISNVL